jgi:hypothetical protein
MNKLIFLNGAVNCGKTTIGTILRDVCASVAFIDIDHLHGFIPWMPIEHAVPLNIKNGIDVARNFIAAGIDVVFGYPLSDEDFNYVRSLIDFECEVTGITLFCSLKKNIQNRGERELSEWEVNRIKWMHEKGLARPGFSEIIDITNSGIDETVRIVIEKCGLKRKQ